VKIIGKTRREITGLFDTCGRRDTLNSVIKKDFKRLMLDTDKVQEYVEVLGQGNAVDAGGGR
jgi:hypothetical protein